LGCNAFGDDGAGSAPGEGLDLAGGVDDELVLVVHVLADNVEQRVHFGREQIEARHNGPIGPHFLLLHHAGLVYRISNV